jgi:hypothetical protein
MAQAKHSRGPRPNEADANAPALPARTDDALAGVTVPVSGAASPSAALPSHLQEVQADLISRQYPAGQHPAADALAGQDSGAAYDNYIRNHDAREARS